jgi:hypothetical protein
LGEEAIVYVLWTIFIKLQKFPKISYYFFHGKSYVFFFLKKWVELHFGRLFHKLIRGQFFKRIFAPTGKVGAYASLGAKLAPTRVLKNWPLVTLTP